VALALAASTATAAIYWGQGSLGAANLDGSEPNFEYLKTGLVPGNAGATCGVAVTPTYLYWSGALGLGRVNLEGPAAPATILPSPGMQCGISADPTNLYWANRESGELVRSKLEGHGLEIGLVTGLDHPCATAVGGGHLYWVDFRSVGRSNLDGSEPQRSFLATAPGGCGIAVDSNYVYWSTLTPDNHGAIGRARLDGSERNSAFITGLPGHVGSVAVDASHVYWTEWHEGMVYSTIGRAGIDGSGANGSWITTNSFDLGGIAVDARPTPVPLPLPSRAIHFGQLRHNLRTGVATLDVSVPARGDLSVTSPQLGWKVLKGNPPPYLQGSFRWRLKVWPGKTGKVAKRLRTQLRNKGKAAVTLTISYNEERQLPLTVSKRISLWKTQPHVRHR